MGKKLYIGNLSFDTTDEELEQAFAIEDREAHAIIVSEDAKEGPRAFADKRQAVFQGR